MINYTLVSRDSKLLLQDKYQSYKNKFQNSSVLVCKNPFVRDFLISRDSNKCQFCFHEIKDIFVVHHVLYDFLCHMDKKLSVKVGDKYLYYPDCESCFKRTNQKFSKCVSRLVVVHKNCNRKLSLVRTSKSKIPSLKEMPIKKESDFDLSYRETDQYKKQQEIYKMVYSMNDDYSRTFSMPEDITEYL